MATKNYGMVSSVEELARFVARLTDAGGAFGFDIETGYLGPDKEKASIHPETAIVVGISFTNSTDWARYAPLRHDLGPNLNNVEAARLFWPLLLTGRGVAHNAPFEMRHLSKWFRELLSDDPIYGAQVRAVNGYFPVRSCTQVESYLAADFQSFGLKFLTRIMFDRQGRDVPQSQWSDRVQSLAEIQRKIQKEKDAAEQARLEASFDGHKMTEIYDLFPGLPVNKRKFLRFNILELTPQVIAYACEDSLWCLAIHERNYSRVKDMFLYRVEMGVLDYVCEMEDYGVRYDWAYMRRGAEEVTAFRTKFNAEIMIELSEMIGVTTAINLASWQQVSTVLYGKLGLKTTVYTKTSRDKPPAERKMSTGTIALTGLAKEYPVVKKILQWREMTRLLGTYLEKYESTYGYAEDGRTHPNHMSAVVITGRFAVADPPYQQSPRMYHFDLIEAKHAHERGEEPRPGTCFKFNFRDAIIAPPEHYIIGFDLSQAELRAVAGEARETALLRAFEAGEDVHTLTASLMLGIPIEQVTKDLRAIGKTMAFALLYGMGVQSLSERLAIPVEEAQDLYNKFFAAYPAIAVWSERQVQFGKTNGYVTSYFGRRLPIWEYQSKERWIYNKGDRACVNYPIQGAATGDYVKCAMVRARNALRSAGLHDRVHLVMNIHDALEFYVHKSVQPQDVIDILQPAVIFPVEGWPPMKADWHIAKKWGSPIELEIQPDGRMVAKGEKEFELVPSVEHDEETGEDMVVLPDVDVETVHKIMKYVKTSAPQQRRPEHDDSPPKHVIVLLEDMPTEAAYGRFLDLLAGMPGHNSVTVRTPEGDVIVAGSSSLNSHDLAEVSMVLGAAQIIYDAADVDAEALVRGLNL